MAVKGLCIAHGRARMDAGVRGGLQREESAQWVRFVTPADRHLGIDHERLAHRKMVYERAKRRNPRRWSGPTWNWEVTGPVSLNPGKLQEIERNKLAA